MNPILVVDDEQHVRDLTSRSLSSVNLRCDTAADGREAIEIFEAANHRVVLTDLRMPRCNGHALAIDLLSRPQPPTVIVVTGLAEPRLAVDLQSRGVENILYKPIDYGVLARKTLAVFNAAKPVPVPMPATVPSPIEKLMIIEKSLAELTSIFEESIVGVFDHDAELCEPPKAVPDFVERFNRLEEAAADTDPAGVNKRLKERVRTSRHVFAVPVTRRFAPCGEPFMAAIRDVSESGIRLLHTRAITTKYLALSWNAETLASTPIRVVMEVKRCQPQSPFYGIAGEYVMAD